jgi:hypothetical protein
VHIEKEVVIMIAVGDYLLSLSQISRALKSGFAVEATLIIDNEIEELLYSARQDVILKMTDLHESAYKQLVGIEDYDCGPCDPLTMYYSWWQFTIIER